jgi:hypothetical protein
MGLQGDLDNKSPFSTRVFRLLLTSLSNDLFVFFLDFLFADNAALSRDDLDRLRDSDPKQYWKLINSLKYSNNNDKTNLIEPHSWFTYFSYLKIF